MKSLSVVIPSYQAGDTLGGCLEALAAELNSSGDEIIVVDSSDPPLRNLWSPRFPAVRWEAPAQRLFPGAARNIGARLASRDWIAFVDADIRVKSGWRQALDALDDTAIAAGGPVDPASPATLWGAARYWIEFGAFSQRNLPGQSWNIPSCNMVWRRQAFLDTGGFPESFQSADDLLFNYREMKLRQRCFRLIPAMGVLHPADGSLASAREHLRALGYWSGRARAAGVRPHPGRSILAWPFLFGYRCCQVWRRWLHSAGHPQSVLLALALARGVAWWCFGFFRGANEVLKGPDHCSAR